MQQAMSATGGKGERLIVDEGPEDSTGEVGLHVGHLEQPDQDTAELIPGQVRSGQGGCEFRKLLLRCLAGKEKLAEKKRTRLIDILPPDNPRTIRPIEHHVTQYLLVLIPAHSAGALELPLEFNKRLASATGVRPEATAEYVSTFLD